MAQRPPVGEGPLIIQASRSHSDTSHSVGLFLKSDRRIVETSTWQHKHSKHTDIPVPSGIRTHNPNKRTAADQRLRPRGQWDRLLLVLGLYEPQNFRDSLFRAKNTYMYGEFSFVDCVWNVMAHAQKPDFIFRRNGRVHLNRRGREFSRLLAAEVCASAVVMLYTPCSEVVWRVLSTHSIRQFPLHFPSGALPCAIIFQQDSTIKYAAPAGKWDTVHNLSSTYLG